jgi:cation transport ATPase
LRRDIPVAIVRDGINDASALAAFICVAMGRGADVALERAEAALLRDLMTGVVELITLSRSTLVNKVTNSFRDEAAVTHSRLRGRLPQYPRELPSKDW